MKSCGPRKRKREEEDLDVQFSKQVDLQNNNIIKGEVDIDGLEIDPFAQMANNGSLYRNILQQRLKEQSFLRKTS